MLAEPCTELSLAIFLYLGWIQKAGVDNWGHFGGLATGVVTGLLLRPRLLAAPQTRWTTLARFAPAVGIFVIVIAAGFLARPYLPPMRSFVDDGIGVSMSIPSDWRQRPDRAGEVVVDKVRGAANR